MVDDLSAQALSVMRSTGFAPAVVVETSPGNFQAWLKHTERLDREASTAAARALADRFGGDRGAADWRHFGRLGSFVKRKPKHLNPVSGLYPFVRLIEANGGVYAEAERFVAEVKRVVERKHADQEKRRERSLVRRNLGQEEGGLKAIEVFRADKRYAGDGTRIDLAYAVYALAHGVDPKTVEQTIRTRDLSHKGQERRQDQYVARTIMKALAAVGRGR